MRRRQLVAVAAIHFIACTVALLAAAASPLNIGEDLIQDLNRKVTPQAGAVVISAPAELPDTKAPNSQTASVAEEIEKELELTNEGSSLNDEINEALADMESEDDDIELTEEDLNDDAEAPAVKVN